MISSFGCDFPILPPPSFIRAAQPPLLFNEKTFTILSSLGIEREDLLSWKARWEKEVCNPYIFTRMQVKTKEGKEFIIKRTGPHICLFLENLEPGIYKTASLVCPWLVSIGHDLKKNLPNLMVRLKLKTIEHLPPNFTSICFPFKGQQTSCFIRTIISREIFIHKKLSEKKGILPLLDVYWKRSKNIPRIQNCYMLVPYCDKTYLFSFLHNFQKPTISQRLLLAEDILQGWHSLDAMNIVHKDLTTRNIFIKENHAFISDFGLSDDWTPSSPDWLKNLYQEGPNSYMPPEIGKDANSSQALATATQRFHSKWNVWSVGVILLRLLCPLFNKEQKNYPNCLFFADIFFTFFHPSTNAESQENINALTEDFPQPPQDARFSLLLWNMLRFDPEKRFSAKQAIDFWNQSKDYFLMLY